MPGVEGRAYQLHLEEKIPKTVYQFDVGTVIYPLRSGRGVIQHTITASETNQKKYGLIVYISLCRIDLYFDNHYWSLPEGSFFAAYKNRGRKMIIS